MSSLLIKNAKVVLPNEVKLTDVLIENGKIASIGYEGKAEKEIDINGDYLLAGFVDIHVHGGGGADFMDATPEAFETAVSTHLKHGTTTILPTAMTATESDLTDFLNAFKAFKKSSEYSVLTPGVHLEGPYFSGANAKSSGAQPSGLLRLPDEAEMDRLLKVADGDILRWDAAPELEGSDMFAKKCLDNGIICSIAHSAATSEQAQIGIDNGFSHVTHFYNAVTTYRKEGQKVLAGVVEAAYLNDNVAVELICDGRHIPRDVLRLALMIKGADKVSAITDGMRIAGTDMQSGKLGSLKNGTDVIVDDTVAKLLDLSSYAGSIATMDRCLRVLVKDYGIDMVTASKMLSATPSKLLGLDCKGSIELGKDADLLILDSDFNIKDVMVGNLKIAKL
ncbi:MAG: N-acetylglucosamine-6-phosphate deacetylase [Clostridia bacterium]|nr:N-acetylglucosamine-6-phosphate deacetylase [Clostridia bacterium]